MHANSNADTTQDHARKNEQSHEWRVRTSTGLLLVRHLRGEATCCRCSALEAIVIDDIDRFLYVVTEVL